MCEVIHDSDQRKFYLNIEGRESGMFYRKVFPGTLEFTHTYVPVSMRGRGIAGKVVRTALEFAATSGYTVKPGCSYVRRYLQQHPEFLYLVEE